MTNIIWEQSMNFMQQSNQAREAREGQQLHSDKNYHTKGDYMNNLPSGSIGGGHSWKMKKNYRINLPLPNIPGKGGRYERCLELALTLHNTDGRL